MEEIVKKTKKRCISKATAKKLSVLRLFNEVVKATQDSKELIPSKARILVDELQNRLGFDTKEEIVILSAIIDVFYINRINACDIAKHFDISPVEILCEKEAIDNLLQRQIILKSIDSDGNVSYRITQEVLDCLGKGELPELKRLDNLSIDNFICEIEDLLKMVEDSNFINVEIQQRLSVLIDSNQHLYLAQRLKAYNFDITDSILYLVMMMLYINNHDDEIRRHDIDDYFNSHCMRHFCSTLEHGSHPLMKECLIEHACIDGQIDPNAWKLTDYSKEDILQELKLNTSTESRANMLHYEDIKQKDMYYNERVTKEVRRLRELLQPERMARVLKRMEDRGMRKGFTCIFYGSPGTGKTETVLQLARETKRDIMLVDVPSIRSKWVGDTEKNIKRVFERYKRAAKGSDHAPILVFNEADAILNKRNEGGVTGVDKMENAMQNIILQEMEDLEGIMIATTNLTGNLDAAFERRFLYKIEFDKPTAKERRYIWKAMLEDLTDEQAYTLADRFDFSGGQIENIARKRIVSDILDDRDDIDMDGIIDFCKVELLNKKSANKIGFK